MRDPRSRHAGMMHSLAEKHDVIADLIGDQPFHYVDYPVHGNIGDLLIMLGSLDFFSRHGLVPRACAPAFSYEPAWATREEVIVFHGGGNFGDLYAAYGMQAIREQVVVARPHNRIIVLPQTLHFSSVAELNRSAALFRTHRDVHICVRDHASYEIATLFTDHVYLLPDMAHQLYPIAPTPHAGAVGTLLISRMDDEKRHNIDSSMFGADAITDWPEVVGDSERVIDFYRRSIRNAYRMGLGWFSNPLLSRFWINYARRLVDNAVALFSFHEHIVTDRLHGHILACLMDKPSTVLDNSYGKNFSYVDAWTAGSELVTLQRA